ncbi:hypothetical protein DFJ74DRAFT_643191 [Hyaloraphidium curvatum]|nr:hypothetical protein DFJ74DRAFT_643191 [Hyaloraphidium curvatum]
MGNPFSKPASDVRDGMRGAGSEAAGILAPEIRGAVSTLAAAMRDGFAALTSFSTVLAKMGGDAAKVLGKSAVRTGDVVGGHMVEAVKEGSKQLKSASKHVGRAAKGAADITGKHLKSATKEGCRAVTAAADTVHRATVKMCETVDRQAYALLTLGYWMHVSSEAWRRTFIFCIIAVCTATVLCCWLLAPPATAMIFAEAFRHALDRPWHPLASPLHAVVWVLGGLVAADQVRRHAAILPVPGRAQDAIAHEYEPAIAPRRRAAKSIAYE